MEKENIKTSIIIPVYNTKDFLKECVDSVLKQTQKEIEIILVDDGSTDGSDKIIQEYADKYSFVIAIHQENQKVGAARNAGVKIANGEYIYFLDSDDYICENLLEESYKIAKEKQLDFLMFDAKSFVEDGVNNVEGKFGHDYDRSNLSIEDKVYIGTDFWQSYYNKSGVFDSACLVYINREFFVKNKIYFEENVFYEDNEWILRMYQNAQRIAYIPKKLYFRRYREGSIMTSLYSDIHLYSCMKLAKKLFDSLLNAESNIRKNMIESIVTSIMVQFGIIVRAYSSEKRLWLVQEDVLKFARYIFYERKLICKSSKALEMIMLGGLISLDDVIIASEDIVFINDWKKYRFDMVETVLPKYPLNQENMQIGIYGRGESCRKFLELYRKYVGEVSAKLYFIDTNIETGGYYQGCPVYNVKDINRLNSKNIIIASIKYKDDMIKTLDKYIKKDVNIQCIPEFLR